LIGEPNAKTVIVPASVTDLKANSFVDPKSIEVITFEPGSQIRFLDGGLFALCTSLKSIQIPASVEVLYSCCFVGYHDPAPFSPVESITFESGSNLKMIESVAFEGCSLLKSIYLPAQVETMTGGSFGRCGLTRVDIDPANLCYQLRFDFIVDCRTAKLVRYFGTESEILIRDEIEQIGEYCFEECNSVSSIVFGADSKLFHFEENAFSACRGLLSLSIPMAVEVIDDTCFEFCESLGTVTFSPGGKLRVIGERAFAECVRLKSIAIPSSVEVIGFSCFSNCASLNGIAFPADSKVSQLESYTFARCVSLESLWLPSSIVSVDSDCFEGCFALADLEFASPCNLRFLLDLPPCAPNVIDIPDTVEFLDFTPWGEQSPFVTLRFGRGSKLSHVLAPWGGRTRRGFLQVTSASLKVLRSGAEFDRWEVGWIRPDEQFFGVCGG
jgi:hypothetical protein